MVKRKIIKISEEKCNGCGECIPNCPEGALQIIDGKARLVSDLFCDGLGACIGHCPKDAIKVIEREAKPYNEKKVMEKIVGQGDNVTKAHLEHLKEHGEEAYLKEALDYLAEKNLKNPLEEGTKPARAHACPGAMAMELGRKSTGKKGEKQSPELRQWPVQLTLVPANAGYFDNVDLLISADCVPFAFPNFHSDLLRGKIVLVGCPKLDDLSAYEEKLAEIFKSNKVKSVTVAIMEVPCCYGLYAAVEQAIEDSGKSIKLEKKVVCVSGEIGKG